MNTAKRAIRVAVDTGGTFTDLVLESAPAQTVHKVPSSPDDPSRAVLEGLAQIDSGARAALVLHGSTVGLNALLTRRGGRTALVTNRGFADLIEIGRGQRPELYELVVERPAALVPRERRHQVSQRSDERGHQIRASTSAELEALARRLRSQRIESLAICLLHSYRDPRPERRIARALGKLGVPISLSSAILPRFREVERFSTTVINAYLAPVMARYLERLRAGLGERRLLMMQNHGGLLSAQVAAERPVEVLLSGPAGGVVGAAELARQLELEQVLSFDMGGTSTDVSLCAPRPQRTSETLLAGLPMGLPALDIHTVGCGGGSIGWVDAGGALKVGPHSAGADPGPAAYGKGAEATITDAHLVLGRLPAGTFLGGAMTLDAERAQRACEALGARVGLSARACAEGIVRIADVAMMRALKVISLERGHDPTRCHLVAYGGAGGLHAARLVRGMRLRGAIIPPHPGAFSARGMLDARPAREWTRTVSLTTARSDRAALERHLEDLEQQARSAMRAEGFTDAELRVELLADLRYRGQSHELQLPLGPRPAAAFHRAHERLYGYAMPSAVVEIVHVGVHISAGRRAPRRRRPAPPRRSARPALVAPARGGQCYDVYARERMEPGMALAGPALVAEYSGTTVVEEGFHASLDAGGNLHLHP